MDWVSNVQQNWKPQVIGDLTIRFPWHSDVVCTTPHELVLEGGAAFGTGDHATTRLCIRWLRCHAQDKMVLDYGCGSAVLAMAALLYGAQAPTVGTDIDLDSLVSARHNSAQNNLHVDLYQVLDVDDDGRFANTLRGGADESIKTSFPPVGALDGRAFDMVVANILAPVLIQLAPEIERRLAPGGVFALSGVVVPQADKVLECYRHLSSLEQVKVEEVEDGWVLITGRKKIE